LGDKKLVYFQNGYRYKKTWNNLKTARKFFEVLFGNI
jgi:hypothetical protein